MTGGGQNVTDNADDRTTEGADREDLVRNRETVEDAAGRILAGACSTSPGWYGDAPRQSLTDYETGLPDPDVIPIVEETDTLEHAGRYLQARPESKDGKPRNHKHWPDWFKALDVAEQDRLLAWSADPANTMTSASNNIGEHHLWDRERAKFMGGAPQRNGSMQVAMALSFASRGAEPLTGPMEPLLRLLALEDMTQWPIVMQYCRAAGLDHGAADFALAKLFSAKLCPHPRDHAKTLHRRYEDFLADVRPAERVLRRWHHKASQRFMRQARYVPAPPLQLVSLKTQRRLSRHPRFQRGIDARQPRGWRLTTLWWGAAAEHCAQHPCERPLSRRYLWFNDELIALMTRGHNAEAERASARGAQEPKDPDEEPGGVEELSGNLKHAA
jgi:hypothetical protein